MSPELDWGAGPPLLCAVEAAGAAEDEADCWSLPPDRRSPSIPPLLWLSCSSFWLWTELELAPESSSDWFWTLGEADAEGLACSVWLLPVAGVCCATCCVSLPDAGCAGDANDAPESSKLAMIGVKRILADCIG